MYDPDGCDSCDQVGGYARWDVLGLSQRRIPDENLDRLGFNLLKSVSIAPHLMDNRDFMDGIDEQFQRLMKQHGNGKGNGRVRSKAPEQSVTARIVEQISDLTHSQREEVLAFIQSLKHKVGE